MIDKIVAGISASEVVTWLIIPAAIVVTVAALIGVALWLASKSDGRSRPSD